MAAPPSQAEAAAFLERLAGSPPIETHISLVFVGSNTAWKWKKAVRLPFVDFTSLDDRHRFAQRELELNRIAAPGLYRDVVPIVRQQDGAVALADAGSHTSVVDWVVRMARVPVGDFLYAIAAAGKLTPGLQDAIADAVAPSHRAIPGAAGVQPPMLQIASGNVPSALDAGLPEAEVLAWRDAV